MSIDAVVKSVRKDGDDLILELAPRWDERVSRFSIPGQDTLRVKQATYTVKPGTHIWGGGGSVVLGSDVGGWEMTYDRLGATELRERVL